MIAQRFNQLPAVCPSARLEWRSGTIADYQALACFHYLHNRPATATRVLVAVDPRPTIVERFAATDGKGQVVAVLVESMPALHCHLRNQALNSRYEGWGDRRMAARLMNAERARAVRNSFLPFADPLG